MNILGELQTIVLNGKDCRVVFQNTASRTFHKRCLVGQKLIGLRAGDWSQEAVRDRVWRGESFSIFEKTLEIWDRVITISRRYSPIYDRRERVAGLISEGFSRLSPDSITAHDLADWLESVQRDDVLSNESFPPATSLDNLAASRRLLAQSLRQGQPTDRL